MATSPVKPTFIPGVAVGPAQRLHVGAHALDQRGRLGGAGREAAHLDQHQGDAQLVAGEPGPLQRRAAEFGRVLLLDVREIERRRRLLVVEQRAGLLGVLPVEAILDALADLLQILQVQQRRGVALDEGALGREAGADVAHLVLGVLADARRQVVEEALAGGEAVGAADVDQHPEVLQAGHPVAKLIESDDAGRRARQQLLYLAA
jgi:hypothetical protein